MVGGFNPSRKMRLLCSDSSHLCCLICSCCRKFDFQASFDGHDLVPIPHFLDGPKWIVAEEKQVLLVQPPNSQVSTSKSKIITFVAGYCWLNSHPNPSVCSPSPRMACFTLQDSPAREPRPSRTKLQGSSMADISIGQRHHLIFMEISWEYMGIYGDI